MLDAKATQDDKVKEVTLRRCNVYQGRPLKDNESDELVEKTSHIVSAESLHLH